MCDTIVALGNSTSDGKVLFAKNSDRDPNEASELVIVPRQKHEPGEMVRCTYIEIPQVEETFRVILAKPFWIWGAEMGSNEYSVTIGNEAVFTREPYGKKPGLIGMDFLRLALERCKTAHSAMMLIVELLERYGQSGNCGFAHKTYYNNSFLICDPDEAWVLETSGKEWAAEKVKDIRSISNGLTIGNHWDLASKNLVTHAIEKGWCKRAEDFSFCKCYAEPVYTLFSDSSKRQSCTTEKLKNQKGAITPATMMAVLRNHTGEYDPDWSPEKGITGADVCMHAAWGPIRFSQSAGSMVSQLDRTDTVHWLTGTAAPCTSLFKPVWLDSGLPELGRAPVGVFDEKSLFWSHEALHRQILKDYTARIGLIRTGQGAFEAEMLEEVNRNITASLNNRKAVSEKYFAKAAELEKQWLVQVKAQKSDHKMKFLYQAAWNKYNREANLEL